MHSPAPQEGLSLYVRILSYLRRHTRSVVLILIFNLAFVLFNALSIWLVAPFVSTLFQVNSPASVSQIETSTDHHRDWDLRHLNTWLKDCTQRLVVRGNQVESLKLLCLLIFLCFMLKNLFAFAEAYTVSFVEQDIIRELRGKVYAHILTQPLSFFEKYQTGNLMSRIINDINSLNVALNRSFTKLIRDPIVILIFVVLLFSISWRLTFLAIVVIPLSGILIQRIGVSLKRKSHRVQERIADVTSVLQESIGGVKVIKAFRMEPYETDKFNRKIGDHFRAVLKQVRLNRLSSPLSETLGVGIFVLVLWSGGHLVLAGRFLSPEDFIRFVVILFSVMNPIKSLGELNNNVQIALASGRRVFELLDTQPEIHDSPDALGKTDFGREILYENVSFRYGTRARWAVKGINLRIGKQQRVALVGSSGAGKSTLVNLLPRFYDVTQGAVRIDGHDVRDLKIASLRGLMGIVSQEVILFNDTVAGNITCGATLYKQAELEQAARLANAYDFITRMPDGFRTMVGERGMRLSGGERQRLSIARAFFKNPPILIFDEATSSLDSESENLIQEAIEILMKDRTVLIIAHRLSSVVRADRIVVLEAGEVLEEGTHDELIHRSSRYQQLYELQLLGRE